MQPLHGPTTVHKPISSHYKWCRINALGWLLMHHAMSQVDLLQDVIRKQAQIFYKSNEDHVNPLITALGEYDIDDTRRYNQVLVGTVRSSLPIPRLRLIRLSAKSEEAVAIVWPLTTADSKAATEQLYPQITAQLVAMYGSLLQLVRDLPCVDQSTLPYLKLRALAAYGHRYALLQTMATEIGYTYVPEDIYYYDTYAILNLRETMRTERVHVRERSGGNAPKDLHRQPNVLVAGRPANVRSSVAGLRARYAGAGRGAGPTGGVRQLVPNQGTRAFVVVVVEEEDEDEEDVDAEVNSLDSEYEPSVPEIVTALSVELGSISEATCIEAPVTSRISLILEPPLPMREPHCDAGTMRRKVMGVRGRPEPLDAPCISWNLEHH
ncbi:hypothetical protein PR048_016651 [Dryococelus australis]|uniref:Uncharacterized protein n=1 Tax=Dryococelus australis TaxID=614101 RepID=A0ABQ9H7B4_9NEOP|nr:hypothetical protein PR048_016651 [Dryococelus australis]